MRTTEHQHHIDSRIAYNHCQECRADCERQFLRPQWPGYKHVTEYLTFIQPRLQAIKTGENSTNAGIWYRKFTEALHRRITLKGAAETGRKQNDSYLRRMGQFSRSTEAAYLRRFAQRGASTLN